MSNEKNIYEINCLPKRPKSEQNPFKYYLKYVKRMLIPHTFKEIIGLSFPYQKIRRNKSTTQSNYSFISSYFKKTSSGFQEKFYVRNNPLLQKNRTHIINYLSSKDHNQSKSIYKSLVNRK